MHRFKETGYSKYIYQNELDKVCFQHDMVYGYFQDLHRRTASDKILQDQGLNTAQNPKDDGCQKNLASMVYKCFDIKSPDGAVKSKTMPNHKLAKEWQKPVIRKFEKRNAHSSSENNNWGADLADIQIISKFNKGIGFYYVLLISSANTHGLFLWIIKKILQLLILLKSF